MLQRIEISGVHKTLDDNLKKYVNKKIGSLDRYMSRHHRQSAHAEVHLKESKVRNNSHCTCVVTLHMPQQTINVSENALNMFAAVDIVEAKLKQQLKKYKELHGTGKTRRHLFARFSRRQASNPSTTT
jgi:putative sigma-54 modulation protein